MLSIPIMDWLGPLCAKALDSVLGAVPATLSPAPASLHELFVGGLWLAFQIYP